MCRQPLGGKTAQFILDVLWQDTQFILEYGRKEEGGLGGCCDFATPPTIRLTVIVVDRVRVGNNRSIVSVVENIFVVVVTVLSVAGGNIDN